MTKMLHVVFLLLQIALFLNFAAVISTDCPPTSDSDDDLVKELPGLNFQPTFKHYSGYLRASDTHFFHYWFTESQNNPKNDPVILWLNGGPGCSSLGGLMTELGPFRAKDFGETAYENPYAWNKVGNVLFIESPQGVGYSYTTDNHLATSDQKVAEDNYRALVDFFTRKFPEFGRNDFYITGESYAGVYLPTLAVKLVDDRKNFANFKGMAIGNGILHHQLNTNTLIPLLYNHALIRQTLWNKVSKECCDGKPSSCDYYHVIHKSGKCRTWITEELVSRNGLDPYNLYSACYLPDNDRRSFIHKSLSRLTQSDKFSAPPQMPAILASPNITLIPVCAQTNSTEVYLNRKDVRKALNIPDHLGRWTDCNSMVNMAYQVNYVNMAEQILKVTRNGVRVLIYNGDVDSVCNVIMNKQFLELLNKAIIQDNTPDTIQHWTYAHEQPRIAGFLTRFQGGIDFVTVRGAGHFVPTDKPRESLQMIFNFVHKRDYSSATGIDTSPQPLIH